jgi:DnaJ-class molecular chaperone
MEPSVPFIFAWVQVLDELTYYELFGIHVKASADEVREAFHVFCDTFHPDRHFSGPPDERAAVSEVFKRGTEAYLVLSDAVQRGHYDAQLSARAGSQPPRTSLLPLSRPPKSQASGPAKLEDLVRSSSARPFARRAEELIGAGDFRQAKLQLVMANHMDPNNEALEVALRELEAKLAGVW